MSSCHSCVKSVSVFLNPAEAAETDFDQCHEVSVRCVPSETLLTFGLKYVSLSTAAE